MAIALVQNLANELSAITSEYESHFAGQPRRTREIAKIDDLLARAKRIFESADQIPVAARGAELEQVRQHAQELLHSYAAERAAIVAAKSATPGDEEFGHLASRANMIFARYYRHFANRSRSTRDSALLTEMLDDLVAIRKQMSACIQGGGKEGFRRDFDLVGNTIELYQVEIGEINKAQTNGSLDERAGVLAHVANDQFALYRNHFAGRSRATRRPALLQRIVDQLKYLRERMTALKSAGLKLESNDKNIDVVSLNISSFEKELAEVKAARQSTQLDDMLGMLGSDANGIFEEYRDGFAGKDRKSVDLQTLSALCDRLGEIARQMTDFSRAHNSESNEQNIDIVMTQLAMFESEYEAVSSLQAKPS